MNPDDATITLPSTPIDLPASTPAAQSSVDTVVNVDIADLEARCLAHTRHRGRRQRTLATRALVAVAVLAVAGAAIAVLNDTEPNRARLARERLDNDKSGIETRRTERQHANEGLTSRPLGSTRSVSRSAASGASFGKPSLDKPYLDTSPYLDSPYLDGPSLDGPSLDRQSGAGLSHLDGFQPAQATPGHNAQPTETGQPPGQGQAAAEPPGTGASEGVFAGGDVILENAWAALGAGDVDAAAALLRAHERATEPSPIGAAAEWLRGGTPAAIDGALQVHRLRRPGLKRAGGTL